MLLIIGWTCSYESDLIEDGDNQTNEASTTSTVSASGILRRRKSSIIDRNKPRGLLIDSWDNEETCRRTRPQYQGGW
jgi:hypothetical protein